MVEKKSQKNNKPLKGKNKNKKKGKLGKADNAGEITNWSDLEGYGVLVVGAYASDKAVTTQYGEVENPIHADVVVFDTKDKIPISAYEDNNFFDGALARKVLNDAEDEDGDPSGSLGIVTELDLGSGKNTYVLEDAPKSLRKAIEAFYGSDAIIKGKHGLSIDSKAVKRINDGSF